jgi:sugar lactone lactonase YvrE
MKRIGLGALSILCAAALAGCEAARPAVRTWQSPIFPDAAAIPRVVVCGGLIELLPRFDVTPALEMFLYGPTNEGRTLLRNPQGMALVGNILLICDQGRADVIAVDLASGKSVGWCDEDHPPRCPVAIAADATGHVYVADTTLRSVLVYSFNGKFVEELAPSPERERSFRPCAVAIHEQVLYIGDLGGRCVARWNRETQGWLAPICAPEDGDPIVAPTGVALTHEGTLLIADALQGCVFRVTSDGRWLSAIGRPGREQGQFVRPKQVCCTRSGLVLVSDAGRQSVLVFRADGQYVTEVHDRPPDWRGFTLPAGILAVEKEEAGLIDGYLEAKQRSKADAYVIVSDALGVPSLTLLGVVTEAGEASHAP